MTARAVQVPSAAFDPTVIHLFPIGVLSTRVREGAAQTTVTHQQLQHRLGDRTQQVAVAGACEAQLAPALVRTQVDREESHIACGRNILRHGESDD